ncbi:hypothetical protein [Pseudocnuella soli]|uniref:hypothetical protein n=1 Tax=Pseudocnuella soli TaxID=2502779 RepID=UPI001044E46C|nr:hypothetical protein [Pseudocnuella soli]
MVRKTGTFYCILCLTALCALSCVSTWRTPSKKEQLKSVYIEQFKLTYFRQLLLKSYNYSDAIKEIIRSDYSGFTEPILTAADDRLIDSLTTIQNEYLKADSAAGNRRAEGAQGKRPLEFIMMNLQAKWLDSLAKRRLKLSGFPDESTD